MPSLSWCAITRWRADPTHAALGAFVTEKIVEPKLGKYDASEAAVELGKPQLDKLTAEEKRGLKAAGLAFFALGVLLALSVVPQWGPLRHPETGLVAGSPFLQGIVVFIFISFAIPGYIYGRIVGTMKTDRDVINAMAKSISSMGL